MKKHMLGYSYETAAPCPASSKPPATAGGGWLNTKNCG